MKKNAKSTDKTKAAPITESEEASAYYDIDPEELQIERIEPVIKATKPKSHKIYSENGIEVFDCSDEHYRHHIEVAYEGRIYKTIPYQWKKDYCGDNAYSSLKCAFNPPQTDSGAHLLIEAEYKRGKPPEGWINDVFRYAFYPDAKGERLIDQSVWHNKCDLCENRYCYKFDFSDKDRTLAEYDIRIPRLEAELAALIESGGEMDFDKVKYAGYIGSETFEGKKKIKLNEAQFSLHRKFLERAIDDLKRMKRFHIDAIEREKKNADWEEYQKKSEEDRLARRTDFEKEYEKALEIAALAHKGQVDKQGADYIWHPKTVASYCKTERGRIAAILHDAVEDSNYTLEDLRAAGIGEDVVAAVDCLTKREGEEFKDYVKRIHTSPVAIEVKLCDMRHNSDIYRFPPSRKEEAEKNRQKYMSDAAVLVITIGSGYRKKIFPLMTADTIKWIEGGDDNDKHFTEYGAARALAARVYLEQHDKYAVEHANYAAEKLKKVIAISDRCKSEKAKIAALLSEVYGNNGIYPSTLAAAGIDENLAEPLRNLQKGSGYYLEDDGYLDRHYSAVASNAVSSEVELARLDTEIAELTEGEKRRQKEIEDEQARRVKEREQAQKEWERRQKEDDDKRKEALKERLINNPDEKPLDDEELLGGILGTLTPEELAALNAETEKLKDLPAEERKAFLEEKVESIKRSFLAKRIIKEIEALHAELKEPEAVKKELKAEPPKQKGKKKSEVKGDE